MGSFSFVWARRWPVLVWVFALGAVSPSGATEVLRGKVVSVADGDTLTLLDERTREQRIRLSGIDAPEKRQAFGERAKRALSEMAYQRPASAECYKVDRYRRRICVVRIDGMDVGLAMIEQGLAWWYREYAREQTAPERDDYEAAEDLAREQRRGLWRDATPLPPWEWRRARRASGRSADGG